LDNEPLIIFGILNGLCNNLCASIRLARLSGHVLALVAIHQMVPAVENSTGRPPVI
jgi:hypothetical protein